MIRRDRRDRLGEGPLWHAADGALYWVDILDRRLNRLALADDSVDDWELPEMTGWVVARRDAPGFLAGAESGVKALTLEPFAIEPFADLPDHPPGNRMNDAKADARGRVWAGTMPITADRPTGAFYRVDTDGAVSVADRPYTIANGPAISPDGRWLFHTDTRRRETYRFRLHEDGTLDDKRLWLRFEEAWGTPDGMTFDAEGGLWIAHWGGSRVSRFDPDARIERDIRLPASQITSMAFAGERLDRMFVTSAGDGVDEPHGGALFEVDPGVQGVEPHKFGKE
ncbi:gluconolaconase [Sphingomonas lenta]|uniref:Gluconolaconase n=1 Tax=Sphingomonas lenta TaxID=1141887 RepID=A0A2A2SGN7_9SPHN|nr:gluconolaconase [Sphingomonas lenta]